MEVADLTKPRSQWGRAEYMKCLGKDVEHINTLKGMVAQRQTTLEAARAKAVELGLDPDDVGVPMVESFGLPRGDRT
jgi:hypothetical protein